MIIKDHLIKQNKTGILVFLSCILSLNSIWSQGTNYDYDKIQIGEVKNLLVWLSLHPDNKTMAVTSHQSFPLYLYDLENKQIKNEFDVGNWYAGSRAKFSKSGKYLMLQQLFYMDYAPNKDREVNFEVMDVETGKSMLNFGDYNDAKIMPDEKYLVTLNGADKVAVHDIETRKELRSFTVPQATNSVAVSADGKLIAVSHKTYMQDLKDNPAYKNNKKNQPILEKYKQQVSVFDYNTFEKLYTIDAFYDLVYLMDYTDDGKYLFIYSIPHTKLQGPNGRKSYIEVVNAATGEPLRQSFGSLSNYEPDFKMSHNGKYFGIISLSKMYPELHIYDFATNALLKRFELSYRLFEKTAEGEFPTDGRSSFIFLPGDEEALIVFGNRVIKWKMEL
jgi:Tol biopolymer transport system component